MSLEKSITELVEELAQLAQKAPADDARSILIYGIKQLKIAALAHQQSVQELGED